MDWVLYDNGLRHEKVNGRVGNVGPATVGCSLRSLGSKTSTYSLFCLAVASDIKADLLLFGRP